jgi:hypothetical protein
LQNYAICCCFAILNLIMDIDYRKFRKLPLQLKHKIVEEYGNYIGCRKDEKHNIELFQLKDFYVEVWRSPAINQIQSIECPGEEYVLNHYVNSSLIKALL